MLARVLLIVTAIAWLATPALAGDEALKIGQAIYTEVIKVNPGSPDPIAASLAACLQAHGDTAGMTYCYDDANSKYGTVLNAVYREVLQRTEKKTADAVRNSQRRWLAFRKAERSAYILYDHNRGTIMELRIEENVISATRKRIAELMMYTGF